MTRPALRLQACVAALAALTVVLAACGSGAPSNGSGASIAPRASVATASGLPPAEPSAAPSSPEPGTVEPPAGPSDEPATQEPAAPSDPPSATSSTAPGAAGAAGDCAGSAENRAFYASIAKAVDWPVVCPVLDKGWFVTSGTYRLANGGKLLISYRGPGGATLSISEGAFCSGSDGCVPSGSEVEPAALGGLDGTLVALDDGGFAIVVDRGDNPAWLVVAKGLDQQAVLDLGDSFVRVGP